LLDELLEHRDPVAAPDHLRVHADGQDASVDMLVHPVELAAPDLEHRARGAPPLRYGSKLNWKWTQSSSSNDMGSSQRRDSRPRTSGSVRETLSPIRGWNGR
jgi:hypothetical protein